MSADIRPVIESLRNSSGDRDGDGKRIAINANLQRVTGFHSETLSNVNLNYAARGKQIDAVDLSAVTDSGQAVVAKLTQNGADNILELTSGDAGSLARFANIYSNMRGGLLNLKLRDRGGQFLARKCRYPQVLAGRRGKAAVDRLDPDAAPTGEA